MAEVASIRQAGDHQQRNSLLFRIVRVLYVWMALQLGQSWAMEAQADVTDHVRFVVPPVLVVMTDQEVIRSEGQDAEIVLGHLKPTEIAGNGLLLAPTNSLAGFSTAQQRSIDIRIASNTGFEIEAQWLGPRPDDQARIRFDWVSEGAAAQFPTTPASGWIGIDALAQPTRVASSTRKTARLKGSVIEQSIGLRISWSSDDEPETQDPLSQLSLTLKLAERVPSN